MQLLGGGRQHPESASQSHMQLSAAISTSTPRFLLLLNACAGVRVALFPALPLGVAAAGGAPPALSRGAAAMHLLGGVAKGCGIERLNALCLPDCPSMHA